MIVRPIVRGIRRAIVRQISSIERRYVTFLNGVNAFGNLAGSEITAVADLELEGEFGLTGDAASFPNIFRDETNSQARLYISSSSQRLIFSYFDGAITHFLAASSTTVNDGRSHEFKLSLVSGVLSLQLDDEAPAQQFGVAPLTVYISELFRRTTGSEYFNGWPARLNFKSGWTQAGNPIGNPDFLLDKNGAVFLNSNAPLGSELWSDPEIGFGWVDNGNGNYALDTDGAYGELRITVPGGSGTFLMYFDADISGAPLSIRVNGDTLYSSPNSVTGSGRYEVLINAPAGANTIIGLSRLHAGSPMTAAVSNISVREAPGAGQWENLDPSGEDQREFEGIDEGLIGVEQAIAASTELLGDDSDPEFFTVVESADFHNGSDYRIAATVSQVQGSPSGTSGWSTGGGIPGAAPFRGVPSVGEVLGGDFTSGPSGGILLFGRPTAVTAFNEITAKELLLDAT